jgi:electron transfer flavoprotein alpha subunit
MQRNRHCLLSTLAILEQRNGELVNGTLSAIAAAKKLGGSVHGFVAGASVQDAAQHAAKVDGVDKILTVDNDAYEKVSSKRWKLSVPCPSDCCD